MRYRCPGGALSLLFAALITACGGGSPSNPNTPGCTFRVTLESPSFGPAGGPGTATVSTASACVWTAAASAGWISISSPSSGTGDSRVNFVVAPNDGTADRSGAIVVAKETLAIAQQACAIQVTPADQTFSDSSAIRDIDLQAQAGCRWQFEAPPAWITLTPSSGVGPARITLRVDNNGSASPRETMLHAGSAALTIRQNAGGSAPQPPGPTAQCTFRVEPVQFYPPSFGGTAAITVTTQPGCAWTASTAVSWLHLDGRGGSGSGRLSFSIDPNPEGYATDFRKAPIEVRWDTASAGQNAWVWQYAHCLALYPAPGTTFSAPNTLAFGAAGGDAHIFAQGESFMGCPWVVESQPNPQPGPFVVTSPAIQQIMRGDGDVHITAPPNPSTTPRTASVVIGEVTLTIVQAGR